MQGPSKFSSPLLLIIACLILLLPACRKDEADGPACTERLWFQDADNDGLGNPAVSILSCTQPDGYVANSSDPDDTINGNGNNGGGEGGGGDSRTAVERVFDGQIDLNNLINYATQDVPDYIRRDNTEDNPISNAGATLGRVLFYDTNLSVNNTIACASCHKQEEAFGDTDLLSQGVNGRTGRHSMRLVNARFAQEDRFFWDERAGDLEEQTTMPIQDHVEMGFSGANGDQSIDDLIVRLGAIDYYQELFTFVYGNAEVTEAKMQLALAQFIRSIQSFDSKYDVGRSLVNNNNASFPNFTQQENAGKALFTQGIQRGQNGVRIGGGAGCQACHRAPEFDIDPNSRNNGVIGVAGTAGAQDLSVTRSPSLRDLFSEAGTSNGPFMHNGAFSTLQQVIDHYDNIPQENNNLDRRLRAQQLQLTDGEKASLVAFLKTLGGSDIYTAARWSNPFE